MWRIAHCLLALILCLPLVVRAAGVSTGQLAPPVELPSLSQPGQSIALADFRGKVVYLDFWASWCGPCRLSFPQLQRLRDEFGPADFEVLAVNVDEFEPDAITFLQEIPVTYPVIRDAAGDSPALYGVLGMPTGYLIDREGIVRKVHQGFRKSDGEKLRQEIAELLAESPS